MKIKKASLVCLSNIAIKYVLKIKCCLFFIQLVSYFNIFTRLLNLFYLIKDPTLYNTPRTDGSIVTPEFNAIHNVGHEGGEFFFIKKDK